VDIVQYLLSFALVIGLLLGLLYALKKLQRANPFVKGQQQRLHIVETLSVGPRQKIAIIRCDHQEFVVGISPQGIQSIGSVTPSPEASLPS
jgi:flagellar protein FliO/FliZ